jgi:hypothetical protein
MRTDVATKDCWIMGQLPGIRMLERELTDAFKKPSALRGKELRRRVDELNSWLNLVEDALTLRTRSPRRPSRLGDRVVTMPDYNSNDRLPAA